MRRAFHQRIVPKSYILCTIGNDQWPIVQNRMRAKSKIARRLGAIQSPARLEPLSVLIDQRN